MADSGARQLALSSAGERLQALLDNNARWAAAAVRQDPDFFRRLVAQQSPKYLWIGCSDSRLPAHEIVGLRPGELFVHRNLGNVVAHADVNGQSALQFAVDVLQVEHVIVVGHYGCSGVSRALEPCCGAQISDHWLGHIRDVAVRHQGLLDAEPEGRRLALLCELNVIEQAINICTSSVVLNAWRRGQALTVHGWIHHLGDGRLRHLDFAVSRETGARLREEILQRLQSARQAHDRQAAARPRPPPSATPLSTMVEPLTEREVQVLHELSEGDSNAIIARRLRISRNTVASHLRNIYQKIGTSNRMHAVLAARALKASVSV